MSKEDEEICAYCGWMRYHHRGLKLLCYHYSDEDTDFFYKDRFFKPKPEVKPDFDPNA